MVFKTNHVLIKLDMLGILTCWVNMSPYRAGSHMPSVVFLKQIK
jgi:hypothetical protein